MQEKKKSRWWRGARTLPSPGGLRMQGQAQFPQDAAPKSRAHVTLHLCTGNCKNSYGQTSSKTMLGTVPMLTLEAEDTALSAPGCEGLPNKGTCLDIRRPALGRLTSWERPVRDSNPGRPPPSHEFLSQSGIPDLHTS